MEIDTGDHVKHRPTGESWVVAYVHGDRLAWCGWPEGEAALADCELEQKATPERRAELLHDMAKLGDDARGEGMPDTSFPLLNNPGVWQVIDWQPIETAPKNAPALFWLEFMTQEEFGWVDTSGGAIVREPRPSGEPQFSKFGQWSGMFHEPGTILNGPELAATAVSLADDLAAALDGPKPPTAWDNAPVGT